MLLLTLIAIAAALLQAAGATPLDLGFVIGAGLAASTPAQYLVSFYKLGYPTSPSWAFVLVALLASQAVTFLIAAAVGEAFTGQVIAKTVLAGIFATAAAAGANKTDQSAEAKREAAKEETP